MNPVEETIQEIKELYFDAEADQFTNFKLTGSFTAVFMAESIMELTGSDPVQRSKARLDLISLVRSKKDSSEFISLLDQASGFYIKTYKQGCWTTFRHLKSVTNSLNRILNLQGADRIKAVLSALMSDGLHRRSR